MNLLPLSALIFLSLVLVQAQEQSAQELATVPFVDLQRYAGTWYEIARLPNGFQKKCAGDVTATYVVQSDGTIQVVNRCRNAKGEMEEAEGVAKRNGSDTTNAKLKVRFAPAFLSFLPFVWGDYWVIDLAADYSYAVVGDPDRKYLWILARGPSMEESALQGILDRIRTKGYDLATLIRTRQSGGSK